MNEDPSSRRVWSQDHNPSEQTSDEPQFLSAFRDWLKGLGVGRNGEANLRESLEELIDDYQQEVAPIDPEERLMLLNILNFGDLKVREVMVPRADIVALDITTALDAVVDLFVNASHSRIPVFRGSLDDVVGMIHIKDLIRFWGHSESFSLETIVREVIFVPPSMPVSALLLQMRASRVHMALVIDEYGGVDGLVTIEDLVEEIVGEIQDEHDVVEGPLLVENSDGSYDADARAEIEELEHLVGCDLLPEDREEEVDTLGGLVFSLLGRVPQRGEVIGHPCGLEFEVVEADPRRIKRLRVRAAPSGRRVSDSAVHDQPK